MKIAFTSFTQESNWVKGESENCTFEAKLFDVGSQHGIKGGRVSKLNICMMGGKVIANYDRGWDIKPVTSEEKDEYKAILKFLENSPKRWADGD